MKRRINALLCTALALGVVPATQQAQAEVPEGQDALRIHTGPPKRNGESVVSISGRWVTDDELQTGFTALTFVNGPDQPKPDTAVSLARKIAQSIKRGMAYLRPPLRGILVSEEKDVNDPQYVIKNKQGISFTNITIRDFTNEKFTAEIGAKSFSAYGVQVAFDIAEASLGKVVLNKSGVAKTFIAKGGGIEIAIGDDSPVKFDTANKTTKQIEKDIAGKLRKSFSGSSLFPISTEKRDRKNIRPFDGGEVQLGGISAKTFTIDINDPSIGVITKYKFRQSDTGSGWW